MEATTITHHTLDSLMLLNKEELDELFLEGETPTIAEISGPTDGRVLAGIPPLTIQGLVRLVNNPLLPWKGKAFEPIDQHHGKGKNRIEIGSMKQRWFHFNTSIIPSLVGAGDVFSLDYDQPGNPWFIRQIRDDLKKIGENLFLGTANFKVKDGYKLVLYFALETK